MLDAFQALTKTSWAALSHTTPDASYSTICTKANYLICQACSRFASESYTNCIQNVCNFLSWRLACIKFARGRFPTIAEAKKGA